MQQTVDARHMRAALDRAQLRNADPGLRRQFLERPVALDAQHLDLPTQAVSKPLLGRLPQPVSLNRIR